jgi:hypothetical protein
MTLPYLVDKTISLSTRSPNLNTCTTHSGAKKAHDWMVDQIADLFHTTHKVKTQQVIKSRGQHCRDIEIVGYLANESDPVPLVLDLRITHDRFGSSSDPSLNGNLHYPNNIDRSLNETTDDKIRKYHADYNTNPPNTTIPSTSFSLGGYIVNSSDFYSYRFIGKLTAFLQFQEFSLRNLTVTSSTSVARFSLNSSKTGLAWR